MEEIKEIFIVFIIALVIGSVINGWQKQNESGNSDQNGGVVAYDSSLLVPVNESNFQAQVIEQETPVLVSFYTESCPYCKKMVPILGQLAQEYKGALKVVRVDAANNPALAQRYDIGPVPAYILIDHGRRLEAFVGAMSKDRLLSIVKPHLKFAANPQEHQSGES
jgi:thioredoxin 1